MARFGTRVRRPVRFYALLEAVIGVFGVALVFVLPAASAWLAPVFRPFLDQPLILNPLRLGAGFLLLLPPATAMGATLPVLVKALLARDPNFGSVLGRLYGWNTLGAVVGAVAGEAALVEWFGIRGTALVAGALNGVAVVTALALSTRLTPVGEAAFAAPRGARPRGDHAAGVAQSRGRVLRRRARCSRTRSSGSASCTSSCTRAGSSSR